MHVFNLKKFRRQAFYEGAKGQATKETRSLMNCYKAKLDSGASAQEAWSSCANEYNEKTGWATKYAKKS